jgi:hypothetical protein
MESVIEYPKFPLVVLFLLHLLLAMTFTNSTYSLYPKVLTFYENTLSDVRKTSPL